MQFHRKKKETKKATRACLKVCPKTHENTWNQGTLTSYERRQVLFLQDREAIRQSSYSPIDNCSLFIRHQEYKSQVTMQLQIQAMQPFTRAIEAAI